MKMNNDSIRFGTKSGSRAAWARTVRVRLGTKALELLVSMHEVAHGQKPCTARTATFALNGAALWKGAAPLDGAPLRAACLAAGLIAVGDNDQPVDSWDAPAWLVAAMN